MAALAALLLLGLSVVAPSPAQAAQGNFGVYLTGRARPAEFLAALRFRDLPAGPAAAPLLRLAAQGVLHGDGSGRIYPDAVISRQEAIVALVRLLGLEGEAVAGTTRTSSTLAAASGGGGAAWAQGYIAAADVHGLTGASGTRGTLAQPAATGAAQTPWDAPLTREEAAAWAVRALGTAASAGSAGSGLLATYTDGGRVSPELRPLVERALELGLISGPSPDHLAPQGSLTRAQLAALLDSLGRRLPPGPGAVWQLGTLSGRLDENEDLGGRAVRATTWEITDPSGSATALKFTATSAGTPLQGAVVLRAGRLALSDTLLAGEAVRYLVTGDGVVPFIEVLPGTIASTAGIITGLEPTAGRLVLSDASGLVHTFTFQPQTVVSVGGQAATPQDLAVGQRVSVRGLAGAAWEVAALPDESDAGTPLPAGTVRGQVRYRDEKRLVLTLVGGVEAEYAVSTGTQVLARGRTSDLSAVQPGDQVELTLGGTDGTWAERISVSGPAGRVAALYRGRLGTFAPRGDTLLLTQPKRLEGSAWQDAGAANLSLALSPDATLWLDGKPVDLTTAAR